MCSPNKKGAVNPTQRGEVVTRTVELATEVYASEVIQLAKCKANIKPERIASRQEVPDMCCSSTRRRINASGNKMAEARLSRQAAITIDGMSCPCAKRTKIDPDEIPTTPKTKTSIGEKRGDVAVCILVFTTIDKRIIAIAHHYHPGSRAGAGYWIGIPTKWNQISFARVDIGVGPSRRQ